MTTNIVGAFDSAERANAAIHELIRRGYPENKISLVARESSEGSSAKLTKGLGAGAAAGGALGLLAGLGAFAIPGLGPILAAGPIVAALEGASFGAIAGGLSATLSDEAEAPVSVLLIIEADDEGDVRNLLEAMGATETRLEPAPGAPPEPSATLMPHQLF